MRKKQRDSGRRLIFFMETLFRDGSTLAIGIIAQTFLIGAFWWNPAHPRYRVVAFVMALGKARCR